MADDPRKEPNPGRETPQEPNESKPYPAPGGVGTGTKNDPAEAPDAGRKQEPHPEPYRPEPREPR